MKHPSFVFACMRTPPSSPVGCKEFVRRMVLTRVTIGDSQKSTFVATANGRWSPGMPQRSVYKQGYVSLRSSFLFFLDKTSDGCIKSPHVGEWSDLLINIPLRRGGSL